ncbi:retrovirus-related pol polyprotein from transposon TNT 1-94 [Tanacetum coccineum]
MQMELVLEQQTRKSQDHKEGKSYKDDDDKSLCLVNDLKDSQITFMSSQRYKSKPEVYNHYINSQVKIEVKDYELRQTGQALLQQKTPREYSNSLLSAKDKGRGRKQYRGQKQNKVENTIEDRIMHSGASFHATYFKEELERFRLRSGKVRLANGKTLDMVGVGDVVLKTSFDTNHGNKRGILYMVEVPSNGINTTIDGRDNAALWHQRLWYMSEKGIKILALKGRIPDLQNAIVGFCEPCVLGKQKKVECLKSDNGGEYSSREFIEYCAENGFRMLETVSKTPQENDVVQRMNWMLNERAKSMRLHAGLSMMFWEDSVNTISYLINSGPSVPLAF